MNTNYESWSFLADVPEEERTEELCRQAVSEDGLALEFVPEHLRRSKICLIAVKQNGMALEFVPGQKGMMESGQQEVN
jgi:hypothetical protein